jgi:hypothetical protein
VVYQFKKRLDAALLGFNAPALPLIEIQQPILLNDLLFAGDIAELVNARRIGHLSQMGRRLPFYDERAVGANFRSGTTCVAQSLCAAELEQSIFWPF